MIEVIIILIGVLFNILSYTSIKFQELDEKLPVALTDTTHVGIGALVAHLTSVNPTAANLGFILFLLYEILDFLVHQDTIEKDILAFAIGFFGELGYRIIF